MTKVYLYGNIFLRKILIYFFYKEFKGFSIYKECLVQVEDLPYTEQFYKNNKSMGHIARFIQAFFICLFLVFKILLGGYSLVP